MACKSCEYPSQCRKNEFCWANVMINARVWNAGAANGDDYWYYRLEEGSPTGPFDNAIAAGKAARDAVITESERRVSALNREMGRERGKSI